jgi:hypothetical protein
MYSRLPTFVLGFHGCDKETAHKIINQQDRHLRYSKQDYDWLGHGIYFWENNPERALDFANEKKRRNEIKDPAVVGAIINLGYCCNLLDKTYIGHLKEAYTTYETLYNEGLIDKIKENSSDPDSLKRYKDCAVIQLMHALVDKQNISFDSVRGCFPEGTELYPGAGFREKNHIQLCIKNPNCIKGYFIPLDLDKKYPQT